MAAPVLDARPTSALSPNGAHAPAGAAAPAGRHPGPASRHADRFAGVTRPYSTADVERLRASVRIEHTLARLGAERLWELLAARDYVHALGALTGGQAVQMVRAGLEAIYLSGWQVAADANLAGQTYPDQSLYPANSVPSVVRRINQALVRADEIDGRRGQARRAPLVRADRGRRRGRLRRPAQRLRADEGDDRGRRRGRALRGPALEREEVRPPRRQGARARRRTSSARSPRRASRPTCSTCPPCSSPAPTPTARAC
jgi:hypothetical protein